MRTQAPAKRKRQWTYAPPVTPEELERQDGGDAVKIVFAVARECGLYPADINDDGRRAYSDDDSDYFFYTRDDGMPEDTVDLDSWRCWFCVFVSGASVVFIETFGGWLDGDYARVDLHEPDSVERLVRGFRDINRGFRPRFGPVTDRPRRRSGPRYH